MLEVKNHMTNHDAYTFKQIEVPQFFWGFTVSDKINLLMYETYYGKLQSFYG